MEEIQQTRNGPMETAKIVMSGPEIFPRDSIWTLVKMWIIWYHPKPTEMEAVGQTRTVAFFGGVSSDSDAHSRWRMSCSAGGRQQAFSFLKKKQRKNNVSVLLHTIRAW